MFDFTDRRTPAERERDLRLAEKRKQNDLLAAGFLDEVRKLLSRQDGIDVGLVGSGWHSSGAELLVQSDGITYRINCCVNRE